MDPVRVASEVIAAWKGLPRSQAANCGEALPDPAVLERLIETAFEASLLREENRPLAFRLLLRSPHQFSETAGPPGGLHRLLFDKPRPFTAQELRRLAPAVDYDRSLVGLRIHDGEPQIWGIVQSGRRWLEQFHGGRGSEFLLPDCLILGVRDPGSMVLSRGSRPLCVLEAGRVQENRLNVFSSEWLSGRFVPFGNELMQLHAAARAESGADWSALEPDLARMIAQQMTQRLISTIQRGRHGGTLLMVPGERADELARENPWIRLKYRFRAEAPRARLRSLIVRVMNALAAAEPPPGDAQAVGWDDFGRVWDREFSNLEEAVFEISHMFATLTAVDGAVVLTRRFEPLGFGGEISGALAEVPFVARALDLEGATYRTEPTEDVGTRHRSVYRLCQALKDVLGIVVSQDGSAQFVRWHESQVMYWQHSTITPP